MTCASYAFSQYSNPGTCPPLPLPLKGLVAPLVGGLDHVASPNSKTWLCFGKAKGRYFVVMMLLILKCHSMSDTCVMDEELVMQFIEECSLITLVLMYSVCSSARELNANGSRKYCASKLSGASEKHCASHPSGTRHESGARCESGARHKSGARCESGAGHSPVLDTDLAPGMNLA